MLRRVGLDASRVAVKVTSSPTLLGFAVDDRTKLVGALATVWVTPDEVLDAKFVSPT
jgi:hypothetical protein